LEFSPGRSDQLMLCCCFSVALFLPSHLSQIAVSQWAYEATCFEWKPNQSNAVMQSIREALIWQCWEVKIKWDSKKFFIILIAVILIVELRCLMLLLLSKWLYKCRLIFIVYVVYFSYVYFCVLSKVVASFAHLLVGFFVVCLFWFAVKCESGWVLFWQPKP